MCARAFDEDGPLAVYSQTLADDVNRHVTRLMTQLKSCRTTMYQDAPRGTKNGSNIMKMAFDME